MASLRLERFIAPLLEPIDLQVAAGECISLSGPSGSGKTRLLRAIADLDPAGGESLVDDTPSNTISGPEWRKRVGLLPAESFWWGQKVGDHLHGDDEYLRRLGFPPECTGWQITRLSSGEKQRLSIARLLQNQPQVLLLDEPTANLDQHNAQRVEQLIEQWRHEHSCAVIWVSHDPAQQRRVASRHYQIDQQRLEEIAWS